MPISLSDYKKRIETSPSPKHHRGNSAAVSLQQRKNHTDASKSSQPSSQNAASTGSRNSQGNATAASTSTTNSTHSTELGDIPWYKRIITSRFMRRDIGDYLKKCAERNRDKTRVHSKGFSWVEGEDKTFNQELEEDAVFDNPYSMYHMERAYNISSKDFLFPRKTPPDSSYYEVLRRTQNVQYAQHLLSSARNYISQKHTDKALDKLNTSLEFYPENLEARMERARLAATQSKWKVVADDAQFLTDQQQTLDERHRRPGGNEDIFEQRQFFSRNGDEIKTLLDKAISKLPPDEKPKRNSKKQQGGGKQQQAPHAPGSAKKKKKKKKRKRGGEFRDNRGQDDQRYGKRPRGSSVDANYYGGGRGPPPHNRNFSRGDDWYDDQGPPPMSAYNDRGPPPPGYRGDGAPPHGRHPPRDDYGRRNAPPYPPRDEYFDRHQPRGGDPYREDRRNRGSSRDRSRGRSPSWGGNRQGREERPPSRGYDHKKSRDSNHQRQQDNKKGQSNNRGGGRKDRSPPPPSRSQRGGGGGNARNRTERPARQPPRSPSVGQTPKLKNQTPVEGIAPRPTSERGSNPSPLRTPSVSSKSQARSPAARKKPNLTSPPAASSKPPAAAPEQAETGPRKRRVRRKQRILEEKEEERKKEEKREERLKQNPLLKLPSFKKSKAASSK